MALVVTKLDRSMDVRLAQFRNIDLKLLTLDVSQLLTSRLGKMEHPLNVENSFVTEDVTNPATFNDVSPEQSINVAVKLVRLAGVQADRSSDVSEEHPPNIKLMFSTLDTFQPPMANVGRLEQPLNVPSKLVREIGFQSETSKSVSALHSLNAS